MAVVVEWRGAREAGAPPPPPPQPQVPSFALLLYAQRAIGHSSAEHVGVARHGDGGGGGGGGGGGQTPHSPDLQTRQLSPPSPCSAAVAAVDAVGVGVAARRVEDVAMQRLREAGLARGGSAHEAD
eukprot:2340329-Prymnesium_polylepis.1